MRAAVASCVAAYRERGALAGRRSRCWPAPTSGWTSIGCTRRPPTSRCGRRSRARPSARATGPATARCRGSPASATGGRRIVEEPPLITRVARRRTRTLIAAALDEYLRHAGPALAPRARRLHAGRRRAQGRRRGQRRAAGLRRAARGQQPRRRGVPAAQAGPPVGAGAATCTASRRGTRTRVSGSSSTSRRCRRSAIRCWAGRPGRAAVLRPAVPQHEGHRPAGRDRRRRRWPTTPGIVGHLLAKGHARTSGASMIAGYVGGSDKLDLALCRFARLYADQTEADHAALVKAVARGVLPGSSTREPGAGEIRISAVAVAWVVRRTRQSTRTEGGPHSISSCASVCRAFSRFIDSHRDRARILRAQPLEVDYLVARQ